MIWVCVNLRTHRALNDAAARFQQLGAMTHTLGTASFAPFLIVCCTHKMMERENKDSRARFSLVFIGKSYTCPREANYICPTQSFRISGNTEKIKEQKPGSPFFVKQVDGWAVVPEHAKIFGRARDQNSFVKGSLISVKTINILNHKLSLKFPLSFETSLDTEKGLIWAVFVRAWFCFRVDSDFSI